MPRPDPSPHVFVVFGATGDLAARMLFPGFYQLAASGRLPADYAVIGSGRHAPDDFADTIATALRDAVDDVDADVLSDLVSRLDFVPSDADDGSDLAEAVRGARDDLGPDAQVLIYLSVPPEAMQPMIGMLGREGLAADARIVVEKPFGTDLQSSRELDAALKEIVDERQVYRVDHFLGKEAVQNILALRFANGFIEPGWRAEHLESVQIDVPEELTIEGRGSFYESTGCFRDMISTHLCQVLGIIAMEPPERLDEAGLRDAKAAVFEAMRPLDPDRVVFGQYQGYRDEDDVAEDSRVETFVALEAFVDTERWRGVPFYLRTGKALGDNRRTVTVTFRPPTALFGADRTRLVLELTDEPALGVRLLAKRPGPDLDVMPVDLHADIGETVGGDRPLEAYERLLLDVIRGDQMLFTRGDEVDRLWQICQPVLDAPPEVHTYPKGSWGPEAAVALTDWQLPDD
ncbi:glucose-6-phosphate dehydrogenase [Mycolicibacterium bacteremicum]|uniref:Glucose-6-phosphate 1-dehydrogenase n=1 Tax=Mycolicibacterium bacteremicum TaxID=564198 RepID=A0A1W9Z1C0_MYCBA|nr:glucose-6-phosphate dehydrogenase [Mycolicibacterium bacteremicum]ORA06094.1 glucose-6-phosphate dehydrogenase [Mycolicibacterium bacteremicum]